MHLSKLRIGVVGVVCAMVVMVVAPAPIFAGFETFTDKTMFLNSAGAVSLESFEGNIATNGISGDQIFTPDITFTALAPNVAGLGIWNVPFVGGFATDGVNWLGYQSSTNETIRLDLNQAVTSFGLSITDWGDFGAGTLTFSNDVGDFFQVDVSPNPNGNLQFFGVINPDMPFTRVEFTQTIFGEFYGLDEIYYGVQDSDNDGIPDDEDACPNSDLSETIVIENCDASVGNLLFGLGCTMADLIGECADGAANHGQFVSCVALLTNEWKRADLITGEEEGRIQSCAARSNIPGDLDGDGAVGVADLVMLLGEWGSCPAQPDACPADLDLDDIVGITDLLILLGNWG